MPAPFHEFFKAIEATPVGVFMRENVLAFPLVEALASHLPLMRWLVIGVILYAAATMLRSAWRPTEE